MTAFNIAIHDQTAVFILANHNEIYSEHTHDTVNQVIRLHGVKRRLAIASERVRRS